MASVRLPTIAPAASGSRAMSSVMAGEATISASSSRVGAGLDDESCGVSRWNAATSSSVT